LKGYYLPEILFSLLVMLFLWSLPTYTVLKIIFILAYLFLLGLNLREQWYRAKTVQKIKEEKKSLLEQKINQIKSEQEQKALREKEKAQQKAKEEAEYQKKLKQQKQKEEAEYRRQIKMQQIQALRSEVNQYLQSFVNRNYRTLSDGNFVKLMNFITGRALDLRLVFNDGGENQLKAIAPQLSCPLKEVIEMAKEYQENLKIFVNLLQDKGVSTTQDILEELIEDEVENKRYHVFKTAFYNEKKALKYTNEVHDYISAFIEVYAREAWEKLDFFVRLLAEDVDRNITRDLIEPLVKQELGN